MSLSSTNSFEKSPSEKAENTKPDHNECMQILNLVLDQEASHDEQEYFKEHIENCMPYFEIYNVDKAIKDLLKTRCSKQETPTDLVDAIKAKIYQQVD